MRTIETLATITPEGKLIAQVPKDISPGECHVVLMIQENQTQVDTFEQLRRDIALGIEQADRGELIDGEEVFRQLEIRNQQFKRMDS